MINRTHQSGCGTVLPSGRFNDARLTAALAICLAVFASACSSGGGSPADPGPAGPPPQISGLSDTLLAPGDTVTITGVDFSATASQNRVVFNNTLTNESPITATTTMLEVIVPQWANSGDMVVRTLGQQSNARTVTIERGVGDVWVVGGSASFDVKLPANGAGVQYMVVPYSAVPNAGMYNFTLTPGASSTFPTSEPEPAAVTRTPQSLSIAEEFHMNIRDNAIESARRLGIERISDRSAAPMARSAQGPAPTRDFFVLRDANIPPQDLDKPSSFVRVTADCVFSRGRTVIYADQNKPSATFDQGDYDRFGDLFEDATYDTDVNSFGAPTDVDGNSQVIILFSSAVNRLTPPGSGAFISGFFFPSDIISGLPAGTTNNAELFYIIMADSTADFGNRLTRTFLNSRIEATLAHEFEHLISFGVRLRDFGFGFTQERWFEEGMAHMAEDLNGMDVSNVDRINTFLRRPPSEQSLFGADELSQRGAIFLFLRYLADQLGEDILKDIVGSQCVGISCVTNLGAGDFFQWAADFFATMYLSQRGITSNPRYNLQSFDMQNDFQGFAILQRSVQGGALNGSVAGGAGKHYVLTGLTAPAADLGVQASANGFVRVILARIQ